MITNQEIGGILLGALGGFLFAKYKWAETANIIDSFGCAALGVLIGDSLISFALKNDALLVTSTICAIVTAIFGFTLFWKLLGGTKGKGLLALAMIVVPAFLFFSTSSFPDFSEPLLQILSTAALGLCGGASVRWAVNEGIRFL